MGFLLLFFFFFFFYSVNIMFDVCTLGCGLGGFCVM